MAAMNAEEIVLESRPVGSEAPRIRLARAKIFLNIAAEMIGKGHDAKLAAKESRSDGSGVGLELWERQHNSREAKEKPSLCSLRS